MKPLSASHRRAADATSVSSTVTRSKVERLVTLGASAVEVCCCNDSRSSLSRRVLTINGDAADELILLAHRHDSQCEDAGDVDGSNSQWMAVEIRLIFSHISDLKRLSGLSNAPHRRCAADRGAPPLLDICRRQRTVECSVAEAISFF